MSSCAWPYSVGQGQSRTLSDVDLCILSVKQRSDANSWSASIMASISRTQCLPATNTTCLSRLNQMADTLCLCCEQLETLVIAWACQPRIGSENTSLMQLSQQRWILS